MEVSPLPGGGRGSGTRRGDGEKGLIGGVRQVGAPPRAAAAALQHAGVGEEELAPARSMQHLLPSKLHGRSAQLRLQAHLPPANGAAVGLLEADGAVRGHRQGRVQADEPEVRRRWDQDQGHLLQLLLQRLALRPAAGQVKIVPPKLEMQFGFFLLFYFYRSCLYQRCLLTDIA
jgi:hypothetical protein